MRKFKLYVEFIYNDERYIGEIGHYEILNSEERIRYNVSRDQFLVHLFGPKKVISLSIYQNKADPSIWKTETTTGIDEEIISILGKKIEEHFL